jgi:Ca2+-binding RTX toxin-like protein
MATQTTIDGTPTDGANPWIDSLVWGGAWQSDFGGDVVEIGYSFVSGVDPNGYLTGEGLSWDFAGISAIHGAMLAWMAVADIAFVENDEPELADIWFWLDPELSGGLLGHHETPGFAAEPLYGRFDPEGLGWTPAGLMEGGYGFVTALHELGHGLGLAHPHDGGSAADASTFPGVTGPGSYGDFDLNQGIWTTMSYNDGWASEYEGSFWEEDYGWQATPMALDIAAIQAIYGANNEYRVEDDVYVLPSVDGAGTFWTCIWDAAGNDMIVAGDTMVACVIDLNEAPLTGENAGGFVSITLGIHGGFTIANGVVIEGATGGFGDDLIVGNYVANILAGSGGDDVIQGGGGGDTITGGEGSDTIHGGEGDDIAIFLGNRADYHIYENADHSFGVVALAGDEGTDTLVGVETMRFADMDFRINHGPTIATPIANRATAADKPSTFQFPAFVFADADGDALTYAATLADGSALPAWLSFDGSTRTFSGTPGETDIGAISIRITASDGGASVSETFDLTVGEAETRVNTYTTGRQGYILNIDSAPVTTLLQDGGWVVAWTSADQDGSGVGIFQQRYDISGSPVGDEEQVNTLSAGNQTDPRIVALDGGGWVVSWWTITDDEICHQVFNADGTPNGSEVQIGAGRYIESVPLSGGGWVTSWLAGNGVAVQGFNADGTAIAAPFLAGMHYNQMSLAALNTGGWVVSWGEVNDLHQAVFGPDGSSPTYSVIENISPSNINSGHVGHVLTPLAGGGFLVSWLEGHALHQQAFDAGNEPVSSEGIVSTNVGSFADIGFYTVIAGDAGGWTIAWTGTNGALLSITEFSSNGLPTGESTGFLIADHGGTPGNLVDLVELTDGRFVAVWEAGLYGELQQLLLNRNLEPMAAVETIYSGDLSAELASVQALDDGRWQVTWTGVPLSGHQDSDVFQRVFDVPDNFAPTVAHPIADQAALEDEAFSFQVASDGFADLDADTLSYHATLANGDPLPSWLAFNASSRTFSGTPEEYESGTISVRVAASDGTASVSATFDIAVGSVNDAPIAGQRFGLSFAGDQSFSLDAAHFDFSSLPADEIFGFVLARRPYSGMLTLSGVEVAVGQTVHRSDFGNLLWTPETGSVESGFRFVLLDIEGDGQTVALLSDEDQPYTFSDSDFWFGYVDAEGHDLAAIVIAELPASGTLTFGGVAVAAEQVIPMAQIGQLVWTPPADASGVLTSLRYRVIDDGGTENGGAAESSNQAVIRFSVKAVNDAPVVANAIAAQAATEDSPYSFQFASNVFSDVDVGDTLTYSASLADGSALPSWLSFDAATRIFSGTPVNGNVGTLSIRVTATDIAGASGSNIFSLIVNNSNDGPTVADSIADQTAIEDSPYSFQFASSVFDEVDAGDVLTFSASLTDGGALPSWLSFNAATRTFSGTPTNGNVSTITIKLTATDVAGASISDTFDITINNVNDAPEITSGGGAASISVDVAENITSVMTVVAEDDDADDHWTYSLTGVSAHLFHIDPLTGALTFAEAPDFENSAAPGGGNVYDVVVVATDGGGLSDTQSVAITVTNIAGITFGGTNKNDVKAGSIEEDILNGGRGNDALDGLKGNDRLSGGSGKDQLTGGSGSDVFIFAAALDGKTNVDRILDLELGLDIVELDIGIFRKAGVLGELGEAAFAFNNSGRATDKADRIIYEVDTGELYYDSDGSRAKSGAVLFAKLEKNLELAAEDFLLV